MAHQILNVLHLHAMGDPAFYRESVRTLEHMFAESSVQTRCFLHDAQFPLPPYMREMDFDVIVLGPTFLCARYHEALFERTKRDFSFIGNSRACKVALPQDDYDCAELLDQWVTDWSIDAVYSVCPTGWDVLYPRYLSRGGSVRLGYTGYVSQKWIDQWASPRPAHARAIDVSYRAARLPANFGSLGQLKSEIAARFLTTSQQAKARLTTDISVDSAKTIPGVAWHGFLENSRACLVTPSGSSLLDPRGEYRRRVVRFTAEHPDAPFQDIADACFPGEDGRHVFTAVSPRNIEAALSKTVQIAVPGNYSDLMTSDHYLPLEPDCSNIADVLRMLADAELLRKVAASCKEAVMSCDRLRAEVIVDEILTFATQVRGLRNERTMDDRQAQSLHERYTREMSRTASRHWRTQHLKRNVHRLKRALGL